MSTRTHNKNSVTAEHTKPMPSIVIEPLKWLCCFGSVFIFCYFAIKIKCKHWKINFDVNSCFGISYNKNSRDKIESIKTYHMEM